MQIALVLYPKFTVLDIIGPFQALVDVPGHDVVFVGAEAGPVIDHTGHCPLVASASFAEVPSPDVVVVPGGNSKDFTGPVASWLRGVYPAATWVTSVCTGSIFLAAAGLLDGVDATTHWAWTEHLEKFGARYTEERVVERGKDHHVSGRVERNRYGARSAQSHRRPGNGPGRSARHRIRPAATFRCWVAVEGARRDR